MDVEHVASSVLFMSDLPLDANVQFMTVMARKCHLSEEVDTRKNMFIERP